MIMDKKQDKSDNDLQDNSDGITTDKSGMKEDIRNKRYFSSQESDSWITIVHHLVCLEALISHSTLPPASQQSSP